MADIHSSTMDNLIACRDQLAFTLTDQFPPPLEVADMLWETHRLLTSKIEAMRAENGHIESGITLFVPKSE